MRISLKKVKDRAASYFVVKDYGHLDMLDDDTKGLGGEATRRSRDPMIEEIHWRGCSCIYESILGSFKLLNFFSEFMNVDKLFCKDNNDVDIFLLIIWNLL
jgi:hypothetical protein